MFGISFFELILIGAVALIVVGPEKLPGMLGTLGRWSAKLRRLVAEVRQQTGIDDILREQGITGGLNELRQLQRAVKGDIASLGRLGTGNSSSAGSSSSTNAGAKSTASNDASSNTSSSTSSYNYSSKADQDPYADVPYDRDREFPSEGADAYGCLPDDMWYEDDEVDLNAAAQHADGNSAAQDAGAGSEHGTTTLEQSNDGSTAPLTAPTGVGDVAPDQPVSRQNHEADPSSLPAADNSPAEAEASDNPGDPATVVTAESSAPATAAPSLSGNGPTQVSATSTAPAAVGSDPSRAGEPAPSNEPSVAPPGPQTSIVPPPPSTTGRISSPPAGSSRGASLPPPRKPPRS